MSSRRFEQRRQEAADGGEPAYPSSRYFQIHFQHLHQLIEGLKEQVQETNRQLAEIRQGRSDGLPDTLTPPPLLIETKAKPKGRQARIGRGNGGM